MTDAPRKLAQWMEGADLTQAQLASRAGLLQSQISRYLGGKRRPELDAALAIERATGGAVPAEAWTSKRRKRAA